LPSLLVLFLLPPPKLATARRLMPVLVTRLKIVVPQSATIAAESLVLKELPIGVLIGLVKEPNVLLAVLSVSLLVAASLFANLFANRPASLLLPPIAWLLLLQLHPSRMKLLQQPCRILPLAAAINTKISCFPKSPRIFMVRGLFSYNPFFTHKYHY
jgi:hypothetical protein